MKVKPHGFSPPPFLRKNKSNDNDIDNAGKRNRRKKQAEAAVVDLQAQLSVALSSAYGRPCSPSYINLSPRRPEKKPWNSPRPSAPWRGKTLLPQSSDAGGGCRKTKVSALLVPARKSRGKEEEDEEENEGEKETVDVAVSKNGEVVATVPPMEGAAAAGTAAAAAAAAAIAPVGERERGRSPGRGSGAEAPTTTDGARAGGHDGGERACDDDDIPELLPCDTGSKVSTGDVWGMLDSYVHRRSEVARAHRHLGVIEAMRRVRE